MVMMIVRPEEARSLSVWITCNAENASNPNNQVITHSAVPVVGSSIISPIFRDITEKENTRICEKLYTD